MWPWMASQPPSASTPTSPRLGIAVSAGLYLAVSRIIRSREPNRSLLASSIRSISCSSWPNPLTTRTPPIVSSTIPATSPTICCASQEAGNRRRREACAISHSAGATASATSDSSGDSVIMMTSEKTKSSTLPKISGSHCSSPCTMLMSEIDRPTSCPVWISSCRAPSRLDSDSNRSVRMACCTSSATFPPRYLRR
jgi:hypothetical protein